MKKREMVASLAERWETSQKQAQTQIEDVFNVITAGILEDERLIVPSFGVFSLRDRKARHVRNPQTGKQMKLKKSRTVGFRPSKLLKARVA